jgi:4-hydroxy-tetrahydrodipicolinate synthase
MPRPVVYSAVPTAFTPSGELDLASMARLFDHALAGGVDALFVNGTTGEFPALSREERAASLRAAVEHAGPDRVIAHVGAASPHQTAELAADALELGVMRMSIITPFYLPASPAGVRMQVEAAVAGAPGARIYLYVFPDRTGVVLAPSDATEIINDYNLAGIKISIPGTDYVRAMADQLATSREVLSGNDGLLPEVMGSGGTGIVSGVSSSVPAPFVELAEALDSHDTQRQAELQEMIGRIVPALGPSIAGLKLSLALQGVIASPRCRMAIDEPNDAVRKTIADVVGWASALGSPAE